MKENNVAINAVKSLTIKWQKKKHSLESKKTEIYVV